MKSSITTDLFSTEEEGGVALPILRKSVHFVPVITKPGINSSILWSFAYNVVLSLWIGVLFLYIYYVVNCR